MRADFMFSNKDIFSFSKREKERNSIPDRVVCQIHQHFLFEQLVGVNFDVVKARMLCTQVTECQRFEFRIVGYNDPLVIVGGQRDLGDVLGGDVVLSGPQNVKFYKVRLVVEKAILVVLVGHLGFHDDALNAFTFLSPVSHTSLFPQRPSQNPFSHMPAYLPTLYEYILGLRHTTSVIVLLHASSFINSGTFLFILGNPARWSSGYADVSNNLGTSSPMSSKKSSVRISYMSESVSV